MPLQIEYFLAPGATARLFGTSSTEEVVAGRASGLSEVGTATAATAMAAVEAKLIVDGYGRNAPHKGNSAMRRVEGLFYGFTGDSIDFRLRYSTLQGEVTSSLVINLDADLESVQNPYVVATRKPIVVAWTGRTSNEGAGRPISERVRADVLKVNYLRPIIRLSGLRVFYGKVEPANAVSAASVLGCVNSNPFLGRPRGSWLMSKYATSQNLFGGTVATRLEALTKGIGPSGGEDWRSAGILFNSVLGKYVAPDPDQFANALQAPYAFGEIRENAGGEQLYDPAVDGFTVLGQYPLTDFNDIWTSMGIDDGQSPFGFPDPGTIPLEGN